MKIFLLLSLLFLNCDFCHALNIIPYPGENSKWGYCNENTDILIKPQYDYVFPFNGDSGRVFLNGEIIFISTDGTKLFSGRYQNTEYLDKVCAPVKMRNLWGCIDKSGKEVIPFEYEVLYHFSGNFAPAQRSNVWGLVNLNTKEFTPTDYQKIFPFSEGYAKFLSKNGKYGFIKSDGSQATPPAYDELHSFKDGYATAMRDGKYGFINKDMIFKIRPFIQIFDFSEGLAAVIKLDSDNKCGYINYLGKEALPFSYAQCEPFSENMAAVKKDSKGKWGYIDKQGNAKTDFIYDKAYPFSNAAAFTVINEAGAYINKDGRMFNKFFKLKNAKDLRLKQDKTETKAKK